MRTLRARLLWRFFLITVPPLAVAAVIGGLLAAQQLRAERQDRLIAGAHGAELALKDIHDGIAVRAEAAARSPELLQAITEGDRQAVLDFAERSVALIGVDHVTVVGADGRVLARGHAPARYGDAYARPGELSAGTLQRQLGPGEGGFGIRIIAPLALAAPGGALVVERAVDHHTLRRLRAQFGLDFVAWDGDRLQATTLSSSAAVEGAAAARVILEQGAEVADSPELDFTYARLVSADAGDDAAVLQVVIPSTASGVLLRNLGILYLLVTGGMSALAVSGAVLSARAITRPIDALSLAAAAAARGDLEPDIQISTDDEIGRLAEAFRTMLERRRVAEAERLQILEELEERVQARTRELRASEEHLRRARQLEALGRLAGGIAHDFNNVLTVILGSAEMLREDLEAEDLAATTSESLDELLDSCHHASALTRQLLAFSGRHVTGQVPVDLGAALQSLEKMLGRLIGEDVAFAVDRDAGRHVVRAAPAKINQLVLNLVLNARDAMPRGGRVQIRLSRCDVDAAEAARRPWLDPGPCVLLEVQDDGVGMDAETVERIFEPFFTTKAAGRGTGMGLATVHTIVREVRGDITVESAPGAGSTFRVLLPALAEAAPDAAAPAPVTPGRGETVLLCEDDDQIRKVVSALLEGAGYQVLAMESAERALELDTAGVDLLLTDIVMSGMNGVELASALRERSPDLRVLFMSGYTADILDTRAALTAETTLLQKPFRRAELLQRLRAVLDDPPQ